MLDQLLMHDRVIRSSTRFGSLALFRWNPIRKRLEVWRANVGYWDTVRATWQDKPWSLSDAIKYKWRTVKWIHTWAEPNEDCES